MSRGATPWRPELPRLVLGCLNVLWICASLATIGRADESTDRASIEFFEAKVRPLLVTHCQGCHGAVKQKGGLRLDRHDLLLKGGTPGRPSCPGGRTRACWSAPSTMPKS